MENVTVEKRQERKPYEAPAVIYEAVLEVRAGSIVSLPGFDAAKLWEK